MKKQKQPNRWSCVPTAFAMVMDMDVLDLMSKLGHDGSDILFPELEEPLCRRGFHPQEIILWAFKEGFNFITLEFEPEMQNPINTIKIDFSEQIKNILFGNKGILLGTTLNGKNHAVAWNKNIIIDPNSTEYPLDLFNPEIFYCLT